MEEVVEYNIPEILHDQIEDYNIAEIVHNIDLYNAKQKLYIAIYIGCIVVYTIGITSC